MSAVAILLAGGSGSRMGLDRNKAFAPLAGRSLLSYSLETCDACDAVDLVVVVCAPGEEPDAEMAQAGLSTPTVVAHGGASRMQSEQAGLDAVRSAGGGGLAVGVIHDAARPFASIDLFRTVIARAHEVGGAIPALPVGQPMFELVDGRLSRLPDDRLVRVQTPQAFRLGALFDAYDAARAAGWTGAADTAETVERFGELMVATVPGEENNLKITHPSDLVRAQTLAKAWAAGRWRSTR